VQAQYELQKHNPPVPHNVPPTAGNIMWSRQLLSRIEAPMQLFAQNKPLMAMKESKKVIKLYNRVSALLVYKRPMAAGAAVFQI
jgi:dynein heavy chain